MSEASAFAPVVQTFDYTQLELMCMGVADALAKEWTAQFAIVDLKQHFRRFEWSCIELGRICLYFCSGTR